MKLITTIKNRLCSDKKNVLLWLWQVSGRYKAVILLLSVMEMLFGVADVVSAMLFRYLVDGAVAKDSGSFVEAAVLLSALIIGELILDVFVRFLNEWVYTSLENRLKERLFSCILHKDYATVTASHSGEWVTRLTSDTSVVTGAMTGILPDLGGMSARLVGALVALYVLEPAFFYVLIPMGLLMIAISFSLRRIMKTLHKKIQEASGEVLSFFQERLENLMILRVFSMEKQTRGEAVRRMKKHQAARIRRNNFSNLCSFGFGVIADGAYLAGAFYCGYGILKGTVSYGTLIAIVQLVGQVQSPFASITGLVPQYYAMTASAERLMEAEAYPEDKEDDNVPADEITQFYHDEFVGLSVKNGGFSYRSSEEQEEEVQVFRHLDLEIQKGEYIAFTGHSGCGKSTLLKLLMCLYPLDEGEMCIRAKVDGKATKYPLTAAWRGLFAYVPQGNQLMSGTIREIIAFDDPEVMAQEERLMQTLRIACVDEFVSELEHGIDTRLGERGAGLSEGQMQRIAIARALFSDRPILILDESTSALDENTEQQLLTNLRQMTDKTVLIITHRPAALQICDREIVMTGKDIGKD